MVSIVHVVRDEREGEKWEWSSNIQQHEYVWRVCSISVWMVVVCKLTRDSRQFEWVCRKKDLREEREGNEGNEGNRGNRGNRGKGRVRTERKMLRGVERDWYLFSLAVVLYFCPSLSNFLFTILLYTMYDMIWYWLFTKSRYVTLQG